MRSASVTRERWRTSQKVCSVIQEYHDSYCHVVRVGAELITHAADIISTVEFDSTGNYLATGDKGGRVVLFERNEQVRVQITLCP